MKSGVLCLFFLMFTRFLFCSQLEQYIIDFDSINGAFDKNIVGVLELINKYQIKNKIKGNIAEIGVYQGKSFIPIYLLADSDEYVLAVDCFDNQEVNYDLSGYASSYDKFIKNLSRYANNLDKLKILKCDSSTQSALNYINACDNNKFRIFSIDGCHSAHATYIDLKNAYSCLTQGGVIVIDDYFNKDWPGVAQGVSKFIFENNDLRPFFIGWNKVLFAHVNYTNDYINLFRSYPGLIKNL